VVQVRYAGEVLMVLGGGLFLCGSAFDCRYVHREKSIEVEVPRVDTQNVSNVSDCADRDLERLGRDHADAWQSAFDGRPLDDRELGALAEAQSLIECLGR